jgi:acetate kinase
MDKKCMDTHQIIDYLNKKSGILCGADEICFTADIDENSDLIREKVYFNLGFMGIELDLERNKIKTHEIRKISKDTSKTKFFVIPTNEELVIARDRYNLFK